MLDVVAPLFGLLLAFIVVIAHQGYGDVQEPFRTGARAQFFAPSR